MRITEREEWGALRQAKLEPISFPAGAPLIVHHTDGASAGPDASARQDAAIMRGVDRFHYYRRRWPGGVGYNYAVSEAGRILEGRGEASGAHTIGRNHWPAVALLGDWSTRYPNARMREAVWELAGHLGVRTLVGHRAFNPTTCPGDAAMARVVNAPRPVVKLPAPLPPHGGTLRLVVNGRTWAGWVDCRGPLEWIAREGLEPGDHAIAWRGNVWRGHRDVTNVARSLVRRFPR